VGAVKEERDGATFDWGSMHGSINEILERYFGAERLFGGISAKVVTAS